MFFWGGRGVKCCGFHTKRAMGTSRGPSLAAIQGCLPSPPFDAILLMEMCVCKCNRRSGSQAHVMDKAVICGVFYLEDPDSIPDQSRCDIRWTKRHWVDISIPVLRSAPVHVITSLLSVVPRRRNLTVTNDSALGTTDCKP